MILCPACGSPSADTICPECGYDIPQPKVTTGPGDRYDYMHALVIASCWQGVPLLGCVGLAWATELDWIPLVCLVMFLFIPVLTAGIYRCQRVSLFVFAVPFFVLTAAVSVLRVLTL